MNISGPKHAGKEGSVFIVALGLTVLFSLILGSFLTMVQGQAASVARSQGYNMAIPVAEAGVEEALSLLNKNYPNMVWTNNLTADGWSAMAANNTTTKSNLVFGNSYYQVTISNTPGGTPVIISVGVVPFIQQTWAKQMDTNHNESSSTVALMRTVQVQTTAQLSLFSAALAAKGNITFSGGATVDSFNSANPSFSSNGQYNAKLRDDHAIVGSDGMVNGDITGSGAVSIRGYVNTGPGGTILDSGSVSIGDNNWVSNSTVGIEASRSNDDFNVTFPDISAPSATFVESPSSGLVGGTNYTAVFQGSQYWGASNVMYQTSLQFSGSQKAIVTGGSVVIYVPSGDTLQFSGSSSIYVAPGSSLTIYCGASSAQFSGSSLLGATNASQVTFYGLPTCTSVQYSGGSASMSAIYAPEAAFQASGGAVITGAVVAKSLSFSGGTTFHYDENLGSASPSSGYVASNWQEIATPLAYQGLPP